LKSEVKQFLITLFNCFIMSQEYVPVSAVDEEEEGHDLSMRENLVGPAPGQSMRVAKSVPMMQVVAPATLPEGYEFEASIGENTKVKVKVPPGGVEEGQTFQAPFPPQFESMISGAHVPVGHWRDGLCDIFRYGLCHPHCWTSCCCALLAAGQVISRLKLTWYGRPGSVAQTTIAFKVIFAAVVLYAVAYIFLFFVLIALDPNTYAPVGSPPLPVTQNYLTVAWVRGLMHWIYIIAMTVVLFNLRRFVRTKYAIPAPDYEDCCCSFWCPCFVAAQMLRHTTDYDVYPATCCTERGIPPHSPSIV
jgi:Cys-rich protein (TIGR01571 family)